MTNGKKTYSKTAFSESKHVRAPGGVFKKKADGSFKNHYDSTGYESPGLVIGRDKYGK